jgi:hypothetical protein
MNSLRIPTSVALLLVLFAACSFVVEAFFIPLTVSNTSRRTTSTSTTTTTTVLSFGLPTFGGDSKKKDDGDDNKEKKDPKLEKTSIGLKGLVQLITAGAGAPFLGDFEASSSTV